MKYLIIKFEQWGSHVPLAPQLNQNLTLCSSLQSRQATEKYLGIIITNDEISVLYNHSHRKQQGLAVIEKIKSIQKPRFYEIFYFVG